MRLPHITYSGKPPKYSQVRFSGIERDKYSSDTTVYDMLNISTQDYPLLSTIGNRTRKNKKYEKPWYYGCALEEYVIAGKTEEADYKIWESGKRYNKGDICAYGGLLYMATDVLTSNEVSVAPSKNGESWQIYTDSSFAYDGDWKSDTATDKYSVWYYNGGWYRNITGTNTADPPDSDIVNWERYSYASLWYNGKKVDGLELIACKKRCAYLNGYIIILPDKMYYNIDSGKFGYILGSRTGSFNVSDYEGFYTNGQYFERALEPWLTHGDGYYNKIVFAWGSDNNSTIGMQLTYGIYDLTKLFKSGDKVNITQRTSAGQSIAKITDGEYVINDVTPNSITFYSNSFAGAAFGDDSLVVDSQTDYWYLGTISISKIMPDMDDLCVANNRVWGCKNDTIYACALGDCLSWHSGLGTAADATFIETGDAGAFVGCCEYGGYPTFFKENEMYRVYGTTSYNFALKKAADYGLEKNSSDSLCVVDSVLFFLSPKGVCAYTGGIPSVVSGGLRIHLSDGVAGTDGRRYYLDAYDGSGRRIYVYDSNYRIWTSEYSDSKPCGMINTDNVLWCMNESGESVSISGNVSDAELELLPDRKAYIESNDFYNDSMDAKHFGRIKIRACVNPKYNPLEIYVCYDSSGKWSKIGEIFNQSNRKNISEFGFHPMRCDHFRIRLECKGEFVLYGVERQIVD